MSSPRRAGCSHQGTQPAKFAAAAHSRKGLTAPNMWSRQVVVKACGQFMRKPSLNGLSSLVKPYIFELLHQQALLDFVLLAVT